MPTFVPSRRLAPTNLSGAAKSKPTTNPEWRCSCCNKILGICRDGRMHLRFSRGHEYLVGFPVQATCRHCGTLNHKSSAS